MLDDFDEMKTRVEGEPAHGLHLSEKLKRQARGTATHDDLDKIEERSAKELLATQPASAAPASVAPPPPVADDRPPRGEVVQEITGDNFTEIAKLSVIEYDQRRKNIAENLGIRLSTLDSQVEQRRPHFFPAANNKGVDDGNYDEPTAPGKRVIFPNNTPAADPMDGVALLDSLAAIIRRFVVLPLHADVAVALWIIHTYCLDAAHHTPILAFTSPTPRCGKTVAEGVLVALVNRPLPSSNCTPSVIFRAIEKWHPTLVVDEADSFLGLDKELRGVLNSGHGRAMAFVLRNVSVGENYEPAKFSTWSAKAIALIGKLPSTLADRSVEIKMRRKFSSEKVEKLDMDIFMETEGKAVRGAILRWATDHLAKLRALKLTDPTELNDRAADNWRPLFAIAHIAGGEWPARAHAAAVALSGDSKSEEESAGVQLIMDITSLFAKRQADRLSSAEIIDTLSLMEERPWPEWKSGRPLTAHQLARLLDNFEIKPGLFRDGSRVVRGYALDQFTDALARYTPSPSVTTLQPNSGAASSDFRSVTPNAPTCLRVGCPA